MIAQLRGELRLVSGSAEEGTGVLFFAEESVLVAARTRELPGSRRLRGDDDVPERRRKRDGPQRFSSEKSRVTSSGRFTRTRHERRASPASGAATASCLGCGPRGLGPKACGSPNGEDREHSEGVLEGWLTAARLLSSRGEGSRRRPEQTGVVLTVHAAERVTARALAPPRARARHARPQPRALSEGRQRDAGSTGERRKCRRAPSRNPEASAGVNPAFPNRVGSEAIRSGP